MNRTFLFLLVGGLFIIAWHGRERQPPPAPPHNPAVVAPTNSTTDRGLVSVHESIHK